jgi:hypothetical protein
MEPEEAAHIFERFYRSDPSRSRAHGGAGLGLSIVSAIVANHGGTVSAQGRVGEGTAFTVHLPAVPPPGDGNVGQRRSGPLGLGPAPVRPDLAHVDLGPEPDPPPAGHPTDG